MFHRFSIRPTRRESNCWLICLLLRWRLTRGNTYHWMALSRLQERQWQLKLKKFGVLVNSWNILEGYNYHFEFISRSLFRSVLHHKHLESFWLTKTSNFRHCQTMMAGLLKYDETDLELRWGLCELSHFFSNSKYSLKERIQRKSQSWRGIKAMISLTQKMCCSSDERCSAETHQIHQQIQHTNELYTLCISKGDDSLPLAVFWHITNYIVLCVLRSIVIVFQRSIKFFSRRIARIKISTKFCSKFKQNNGEHVKVNIGWKSSSLIRRKTSFVFLYERAVRDPSVEISSCHNWLRNIRKLKMVLIHSLLLGYSINVLEGIFLKLEN